MTAPAQQYTPIESIIADMERAKELEQELEYMADAPPRQLRLDVGDASVRIRPSASIEPIPDQPAKLIQVAAPTPVGATSITIEEGDTIGSVWLLLLLTMGLLAQGIIGMWAYFWLRLRYALGTGPTSL